MISVYLNGRLGNQLFQYSLCRLISYKNGYKYHIPRIGEPSTEKQHISNYFENLDLGIELENNIQNIYREDHTVQEYNPNLFKIKDNTKLWGFFQSSKYFEDDVDLIRSWFSIKKTDYCDFIINKYPKEEYCYIHLRGTDYKNHSHWCLNKDYYENSMKYVKDLYPNLSFLIVTDDLNMCSEFFPNVPAVSNDMLTDFYVLTNAKYLIISNSSFSWWAAWLKDKDLIMSPNNWLNYNKPELGFYPKDIKTKNFTYI